MSRYAWDKKKESLPRYCERIAEYWSTLVCFDECASGRAASMKYKAVRAFKDGLRERGLPEKDIHQAYIHTLALARLKMVARGH